MNVGELSKWILSKLTPRYGDSEARSMSRIIMEDVLNYTPVQVIMNNDMAVPDFIPEKISRIVHRILANEPIQYVMGEARFCGLSLKVTPAVLIPRPETEELVDLIIKQWSTVPDINVLDLCTGSGCIAVALARGLRFPHMTAIDISADALSVAKENASGLKVKIDFRQADALNLPPDKGLFDIIVSNPPYIAEHERADMPANVIGHEPDIALFVPDSDPLEFYSAISRYAMDTLTERGTLYFEINPLFTQDLEQMLRHTGFNNITIMADMYGKQRFAIIKRD